VLEHLGVEHFCDTQTARTRQQVEGLAGKQVPRLVHRQIKPAATVLCHGPGGATEALDGVESQPGLRQKPAACEWQSGWPARRSERGALMPPGC
jgi:hypothetical protein